MLRITRTIAIDEALIEERFIRSSGPGGQNVNKVASAVQLRYNAAACPALPEDVRRRLTRIAGRRMTAAGVLVIDAREHRTQEQNRRAAMDRLVGLLRQAARPPKVRRPTRPTAAAKTRRLESKRRRSRTKQTRRDGAGWQD